MNEKQSQIETDQDTRVGYCERCINGRPQGWIYEKRLIRGLIYEFSGRCKCQPGGWV